MTAINIIVVYYYYYYYQSILPFSYMSTCPSLAEV